MHFVDWKIPQTVLERRTLCFSSFKNRRLKVKLWWAGARERKKRAFFVPFILSEEKFFNICVLSQCIEYTFRIYILFHIKKHYFIHFLLVFKIVETLQFILNKKLRPEISNLLNNFLTWNVFIFHHRNKSIDDTW